MADASSFMDDLLSQMFGGGGGVSGASFGMFDDFDDFVKVLEKGNDKATRKMFRDLGRNCRPGAKNRKK